MPNEADYGNEAAEIFNQDAINAAAKQHKPLPLTGFCHNCEEETAAHFCSKDCMDDYEYRQNIRRKQGLA